MGGALRAEKRVVCPKHNNTNNTCLLISFLHTNTTTCPPNNMPTTTTCPHNNGTTKTQSEKGPSDDVRAINRAIGAASAFSLRCRSFVRRYVPAIIKAVKTLPLDEVPGGRGGGVTRMR